MKYGRFQVDDTLFTPNLKNDQIIFRTANKIISEGCKWQYELGNRARLPTYINYSNWKAYCGQFEVLISEEIRITALAYIDDTGE